MAEVVGQHCAGEPSGVGSVVPRWDVFEAGAFFEVADGEFDDGVLAMELVGFDRLEVHIRRRARGDVRVSGLVAPQRFDQGVGAVLRRRVMATVA